MLNMSVWLVILFIPLQLRMIASQPQSGIMKKPEGCNLNKCGDFLIPYPFGIGPNCSYNHFFDITCKNNSTPFLTQLDLEVLYLENVYYEHTLYISYPFTNVCSSDEPSVVQSLLRTTSSSFDSPYIFPPDESSNLLVKGCNASVAITSANGRVLKECTLMCDDEKLGSSVCQIKLPYINSSIGFSINGNKTTTRDGYGDSTCVLMGLTNIEGYVGDFDTISALATSLIWNGTGLSKSKHSNCTINKQGNVEICRCEHGYHGNPYLPNGCQVPEECKGCRGKCVFVYDYNNSTSDDDPNAIQYQCKTKPSVHRALALGLSTSIGSMVLLVGGFLLYRMVKRMKETRRKAKNFKQNGGLLLQQHMNSNHGVVERTITFSSKELEKATDYFNKDRVLGHGGQGTVYKGMLSDGRIVAIKKAKKVDGKQSQQFINEVVILSQINHRNVVKLLGCCLETEVPLLVYEYVPNGMLSQHIHKPREDFYINWKMRLQIAVEIAGALSYLHSSSSAPVYHRDIKSSNILLDENYRAKIADFGISRTISIDQTHLTTKVVGTFGYLDPEYFRSQKFTEKSDVYSFGIVLLELLTGKEAVLTIDSNEHKSLALQFFEQMESSKLVDILDLCVANESKDELLAVANLATRCLSILGNDRPTMKEVATALEGIRSQQSPSLGKNCEEIEDGSGQATSKTQRCEDVLKLISCTSSFFSDVI